MVRALLVSSVLGSLFVACGPSGGGSEGCKDKIIAGDLVITEVFADFQAPAGGTGADEGKEWFEVYNASDRPIELEGLEVVHSRPDGSKAKSHVITTVTIAPGQFLVLGNSADDLLPAYVDYGYSADLGDLFNTDGGLLALKCGATEIDSAQYAGVKSGHSRELTSGQPPDYTLNDNLEQWCQGNDTEFEAGNFGTPGQDNDCTPVIVGLCNDGGTMREAVAPTPGQLIITELMPNPALVSDTAGEWFEVEATADVDLNGIALDRVGDTMAADKIESLDCIHVAAGERVVFAKNLDMAANGGVTGALGPFKFSLTAASKPGDIAVMYGSTVIDAITFTTETSGKALQLDPDFVDATANDSESNFCLATTAYNGTDLGTPGAPNAQCSAQPTMGQCLDNGTPRAIVKPTVGQLVVTEALSNPAGTGGDAMFEYVEILNTGAAAFDLNELTLQSTTSTTSSQILSSACVSVAPNAYALLAHSADPAVNGGLPAVDATFASALNLSRGVQVLDGTTPIDVANWSTASATDGKARELKPTNLTATDNDVTTNYCDASGAPYGTTTNLGTPKAANVCP